MPESHPLLHGMSRTISRILTLMFEFLTNNYCWHLCLVGSLSGAIKALGGTGQIENVDGKER